MVETIGHSLNQGQIILNGKTLQAEGNSKADSSTVGFLVSSIAKLDPQLPNTQIIIGEFQDGNTFTANYDAGFDKTIYFRAFIENTAGTTYGSTLKIVIQSKSDPSKMNPQEKALSTLKSDSVEIPGGWLQNSWFGSYKDFENGWIFHAVHGWLYVSSDSINGIWAWSRDRGWVWSTNGLYPFLYQSNIGNWIYYMTTKNGVAHYYNYSIKSVEVHTP